MSAALETYTYRLSQKQTAKWYANPSSRAGVPFQTTQTDRVEHVADGAPWCIEDCFGEEVANG